MLIRSHLSLLWVLKRICFIISGNANTDGCKKLFYSECIMSVWWVWSPRVIGVPQAHVRVARCLIWAGANDQECHETPVYFSKACNARGGRGRNEQNDALSKQIRTEWLSLGQHSPFRGHYHCSRMPITFLPLQSCSHHGQGWRETEREVEWERQKEPVFVLWKSHHKWALLRLQQYYTAHSELVLVIWTDL